MPCCKNPGTPEISRDPNSLRRIAVSLLCAASILPWGTSNAAGLAVKTAQLTLVDEVYNLDAGFDIALSDAVQDAIGKGIPIYFVIEFQVTRSRLFWYDEKITEVKQNIRLSYHALTRRYQLSAAGLHRNFASLPEAVDYLGDLHDWPVLERQRLEQRENYSASVRIELDRSKLPKPLQVNALGSEDWELASDWYQWSLTP
ncbi:MAG: DUF4390 domain-containing protein [Burkholderiales bacterium]